MLFLLSGWRRTESFKHFSRATNWLLMMLGVLLLLMQLHGYQHSAYPDDFPLNKDDHSHVHEDMEAEMSPLSGYQKRLDLAPKAETDASPAADESIESPLAPEIPDPSLHQHGDGAYHTH